MSVSPPPACRGRLGGGDVLLARIMRAPKKTGRVSDPFACNPTLALPFKEGEGEKNREGEGDERVSSPCVQGEVGRG